jgi:copper chaperone CopZ
MNNINFKLAGLTCEACAKLATNRFKKVPGVTEVNIDLSSGEVQVSGPADLDLGILSASLEGTHYSIVE